MLFISSQTLVKWNHILRNNNRWLPGKEPHLYPAVVPAILNPTCLVSCLRDALAAFVESQSGYITLVLPQLSQMCPDRLKL